MTLKDQTCECIEHLEDGMISLNKYRDCWQNDLIYWICKSVVILLKKSLKNGGNI
jgi:hypothetical protein